jgi:hypothetical protein
MMQREEAQHPYSYQVEIGGGMISPPGKTGDGYLYIQSVEYYFGQRIAD